MILFKLSPCGISPFVFMKVIFNYNQEKDIRCVFNYGRSSTNSNNPTKIYKKLVSKYGEHPTKENASNFIEQYFSENNIDIQNYITNYQKDWDSISDEYQKKAEALFQIALHKK